MAKPTLMSKNQTAGFMIFSSLMLLILTTTILALFLNRLKIQEQSKYAPTRRIQDLVTLLKEAETRRTLLETQYTELQKKLVHLEKSDMSSPEAQSTQAPEVQKLYRLAGFTPENGRGLTITLQDTKNAESPSDPHSDPNSGKLQADDLLKLTNELKAAGASAISINDQRLIMTSEIIAAGPTILVNQTRLTQPVVIKAIGDPDILLSALKIRGGILEYLDFFNIKTKLEKSDKVNVPAYKGPIPS